MADLSPGSGRRPGPRRGPTIEQARAFCAVAEAGSYAQAAIGLEAEPVALTRLVARFTSALGGQPLLIPNYRGSVRLTAAGEAILPAARRFRDAASALVAPQAGVRFSAYPSIARQVVKACPELLKGELPLILFDVSEEHRQQGGARLVADVESGALDIAVAPAGQSRGRTIQTLLYQWQLRVMFPKRGISAQLRARKEVRPVDLRRFVLAAAPPGHLSRAQLDAAFASDGIPLRVDVESRSQEMLRDLVTHADRHAAILPDDAFGGPDPTLGPRLVTADRRAWGGRYAIYTRKPAADRALLEPDERRKRVAFVAGVVRRRLGDSG